MTFKGDQLTLYKFITRLWTDYSQLLCNVTINVTSIKHPKVTTYFQKKTNIIIKQQTTDDLNGYPGLWVASSVWYFWIFHNHVLSADISLDILASQWTFKIYMTGDVTF